MMPARAIYSLGENATFVSEACSHRQHCLSVALGSSSTIGSHISLRVLISPPRAQDRTHRDVADQLIPRVDQVKLGRLSAEKSVR
jgi:hypothetical protein